jgi:dTDP-4-dehydrorhamnose 3,5-epimerase-like enzyme
MRRDERQPVSAGYTRIELSFHEDARGALTPIDFADLPFRPERVFTVTQVPPGSQRGGHGHREQRQLLACVAGRVVVEVRAPGATEAEVTLQPGKGLLVEAGVWSAQTYETEGAVLMVMTNGPYDPDELFDEPPDA